MEECWTKEEVFLCAAPQCRSLTDPVLEWVQSRVPPCPPLCWLCTQVHSGSARTWPQLWVWVPGQEGQAQHVVMSPSAPAACRAGLAALEQTVLSLTWLCLAGGRGVLMPVLCSHTALMK